MIKHVTAAMSIAMPFAAALGFASAGGVAHAQAPALTSVVHAPAGDVRR